MDQFAQLRDRVKEFRRRRAQVLFVLPEEAAYNRQWLRSRDKWGKAVPEFFEDSADKHPWLRSRGSGAGETDCPVLADPSFTTSADYGVALQGFWKNGNLAATFLIDPEGVIRFQHRSGDRTFNRPSVNQLLKAIDGLGKAKK
jgi:alkyl hydroperoxide reductase subunit AhpC